MTGGRDGARVSCYPDRRPARAPEPFEELRLMKPTHTWLLIAAFVAGAWGCGAHQPGPVSAVRAYSDALARHDYDAAYELMSARFRAQHSRDDFAHMMQDNTREVNETAARLGAPHQDLEVSAEFSYGLGDRMRLVREDGDWRIASNPIQFYGQATPREALRSFVRAYRLKRWEVMLRFVPDKYRERMTVDKVRQQFDGARSEDTAARMNLLEANLGAPITERGGEARMPYGDRFEVKFVREEGLWKLQDLD
jgi:hypothetical protein